MEKTTIGLGMDYLFGYVDGDRYMISNTVEQITAFIMENQFKSTMITDVMDNAEIETVMGGFIMNCKNKQFLMEELLPCLSPTQMGDKEAEKFVPYVVEEEFVVQNVIMNSAGGYFLGSVSYEEGFAEIYDRKSGYFPTEQYAKEAYPDAISRREAEAIAIEKGWQS